MWRRRTIARKCRRKDRRSSSVFRTSRCPWPLLPKMPRDCAAIAHKHRGSGWCGRPSAFLLHLLCRQRSKQTSGSAARAGAAASACEQQAITTFVIVRLETGLPPCRLSGHRWFGQVPRRGLRLRVFHAIAEAIMVENAHGLDGVRNYNLGIANLDEVVAIALFTPCRKVGRSSESYGVVAME